MNKAERLKMERLERLLEAEKERSEKAWIAYREVLYKLVDAEMKLERIDKVMRGEE